MTLVVVKSCDATCCMPGPLLVDTFVCLFHHHQAWHMLQEGLDYTSSSGWSSLDEAPTSGIAQPRFKLFDDVGNMVPNAKEGMAAWEAKRVQNLDLKTQNVYEHVCHGTLEVVM